MSRAVELECESMGLQCGVGSSLRQPIPATVTIVDLDTIEVTQFSSDTLWIGISKNSDNMLDSVKRNYTIIFHRPFPMAMFKMEISKYFEDNSMNGKLLLQSQELQQNWDQIHLTPTEAKIINILYAAKESIVPFEDIIKNIEGTCDRNELRVHVSNMKAKLSLIRNGPVIRNKKGKGYYLTWEK